MYADEGCHLTPAGKGPGSRVAGWQRLHTYLRDGPACPHHRALGWDTCPMLHAFSTCPRWFDELSELPHATTGDPEDADTNAPDHHGDRPRYLLINLGGGPDFPVLGAVPVPASPGSRSRTGPEVLQSMGTWAVRPDVSDAAWLTGGTEERKGAQPSPFA